MADRPFQQDQKQVTLTEVCPQCAKPKATRKGSLTGWVFGANRCHCASVNPQPDKVRTQNRAIAKQPTTDPERVDEHDKAQMNAPDFGGQYETMRTIGSGGMGTVYKVRRVADGAIFAAKVLNKNLAADETKVRRFLQEATAAKALSHENIAAVYSCGECPDRTPFLIMEYVDGKSLADLLSVQFSMEAHSAIDIFIKVCEALEHAHLKGVIHRDLKPSNIVIQHKETGERVVKLVDFGIAKVVSNSLRETTNLTESGDIFGSPPYMSPEQCLGYQCDARSDIYSLGCVMYEVLTGKPPFSESNAIQTIVQHLNVEPKALVSTPWQRFPKSLNGVISRVLAKDPANRYQSVRELKGDLALIQNGKKPKTAARKKNAPAALIMLPLIASLDLLLFFGIFQQYTACVQVPERAKSIIAQTNELSKEFYDAGVAIGGYSITKSPVFADRYDKIVRDIPNSFEQLKGMVGADEHQQVILHNVGQITETGLQLLGEAKSDIDGNKVDVAQFHARHMYKEIRGLGDRLQEEMKSLVGVETAIVADKYSLVRAKAIAIFEALAVVLMNLALIWFFVRRQSEESWRRMWRIESQNDDL